jgi:hypothetical protein
MLGVLMTPALLAISQQRDNGFERESVGSAIFGCPLYETLPKSQLKD